MTLLISVLFVCHFLADFTPMSRPWMLAAKSKGTPLGPIAAHGGVHATLQYFAVWCVIGDFQLAAIVGIMQFISHTYVDVAKGRMQAEEAAFRDPAHPLYWGLFGLDQLAHALCIILEVAYLQKHMGLL